MKPILEIKNLSKKFKIRHDKSAGYLSLRDSLSEFFRFSHKTRSTEEFWALKDISFDVYPGESIAIIGKNGAGKSTLLKILSRITPPSEGKIISRGRIASLLEVGTGFHPELTGKENIFLNGSILGMKEKEIRSKFDEIVDFSGVENFLDTALKHYSSGMQLRLAFAVAAFLEPEIMIIDEVLAVGDAQFQKKCIKKMEGVSRSGRTLLFVSHSMNLVQSLCSKAVILEAGRTSGLCSIQEAIQKYLYGSDQSMMAVQSFGPDSSKEAFISEVRLVNSKGELTSSFETCEDIFVEILWVNNQGVPVSPNVEVDNMAGIKVFWSVDANIDWDGKKKSAKGTYLSRMKIPANFLNAGEFYIHVGLDAAIPAKNYDSKLNLLHFSLKDPMDERCQSRGNFVHPLNDFVLFPALPWTWEKIE